jgi:hypothetical protein
VGSKEVIRGDGREIHHWVAYDGTRGALPTYHLLGCSSRGQNFLLIRKEKTIFSSSKILSKKVFVLITLYSLREKCLLGEERQQQQYLE